MVYLQPRRRFSVLRYLWLVIVAFVVLATAAFFTIHFVGHAQRVNPMPRDYEFWISAGSGLMSVFSFIAVLAHKAYSGQNGTREWDYALGTVGLIALIANTLTWFW